MTPPTKFLGSPYLQDPDLTIWNGDVREVLRSLPDESVQMCVTSPPYWGLRDYGTGAWEGGEADCDHIAGRGGHLAESAATTRGGAKQVAEAQTVPFRGDCGKCGATRVDNQIGLEPTPEVYVASMVEVFREVRRVLRKDGTLWLNLGDSYISDPGKGGSGPGAKQGAHIEYGRPQVRDNKAVHDNILRPPAVKGLPPKNLAMIPARVALALQADGWYLRSEITWCKPNPMPESVTDRPTQATEKVYLLSKSARYFYDAEAVREPYLAGSMRNGFRGEFDGPTPYIGQVGPQDNSARGPDGRRVTTVKGQDGSAQHRDGERWPNPSGRNLRNWWEIATEPYPEAHFATYPQELVRRCILAGSAQGAVVLDPFAGSGTTAYVARKLARRSVLVELSEAYCELAARRTHQLSLEAEVA